MPNQPAKSRDGEAPLSWVVMYQNVRKATMNVLGLALMMPRAVAAAQVKAMPMMVDDVVLLSLEVTKVSVWPLSFGPAEMAVSVRGDALRLPQHQQQGPARGWSRFARDRKCRPSR